MTSMMSISSSVSSCKRVYFLFFRDWTFPVAILIELLKNVPLGVNGSVCIKLLKFVPCCGIPSILDASFCFFLLS